MANIIEAPPTYELPLSKGGDLVINFQQVDPDDAEAFLEYGDGVSVTLTIDTAPPTVASAEVDGYDAVVRVESEVADLIKKGTNWRVVVSTPGSPSTEIVAANGTVVRFDG